MSSELVRIEIIAAQNKSTAVINCLEKLGVGGITTFQALGSGIQKGTFEYEPEENKNRNYSFHNADNKGVFAIMRIANRILGCDDSYYLYYKITCNYPDMIDSSVVKGILNETNPDYIWIIGFDLFNRMPFINGQGPDLVTKNGFARTYTIWDETTSKSILTLPMPHPRTPGFDSDVEKIWHNVLVELFKQ